MTDMLRSTAEQRRVWREMCEAWREALAKYTAAYNITPPNYSERHGAGRALAIATSALNDEGAEAIPALLAEREALVGMVKFVWGLALDEDNDLINFSAVLQERPDIAALLNGVDGEGGEVA